MTLTINLSEKLDAALKAQARATGISEAGFVEKVLEEVLDPNQRSSEEQAPVADPGQSRPLSARIREIDFRVRRHLLLGELYERAVHLEALLGGRSLVTTDEVLGEFLTFFSGSLRLRRRAVETVRQVVSDRKILVVPQSRESFLSGFELYAARPDKRYSITDCVSMQTMRRQGLTDILTNDRHFEQEGFRALFRIEI